MCVALASLFVALGGTTWAATSLPRHSVGPSYVARQVAGALGVAVIAARRVPLPTATVADAAASTSV
jgi:hypothetical protein